MSKSQEALQQSPEEVEVSMVIDKFVQEGAKMLEWDGDSVSGHEDEDIPEGAVNDFAPVGSKKAREWVKESLANGWSYGPNYFPRQQK